MNKNHRYKKPFGETLGGRLALGAVRIAKSVILPHVPVLGDVSENIRSRDGGLGRLDPAKLVTQLIRLVLFGIVLWQFFQGRATFRDLLSF